MNTRRSNYSNDKNQKLSRSQEKESHKKSDRFKKDTYSDKKNNPKEKDISSFSSNKNDNLDFNKLTLSKIT